MQRAEQRPVEVQTMKADIDDGTRLGSQRLAELRREAAELECRLARARVSLERELSRATGSSVGSPGRGPDSPGPEGPVSPAQIRRGGGSRTTPLASKSLPGRSRPGRSTPDPMPREQAPPSQMSRHGQVSARQASLSQPSPAQVSHSHVRHETLGFPEFELPLDDDLDRLSDGSPARERSRYHHGVEPLVFEELPDEVYRLGDADLSLAEDRGAEPLVFEELPDQAYRFGDSDQVFDADAALAEDGAPDGDSCDDEHHSDGEEEESDARYASGVQGPGDDSDRSDPRTEELLIHGRRTARLRQVPRSLKVITAAVIAAALGAIAVAASAGGGASWPASVATVQREAARACRNPNVVSEPGQVNFACAKGTRQILWVFALLTSHDNPNFDDPRTGRTGLEPITPAQGGEVAWSLNLHHPYDPADPIDSLEVAARAINNIVGGATLTGAHGNPVVQPGLESRRANCIRYTGSPARTSRPGYPRLCARPLTTPAGQAALVAEIYRRWVVGAGPAAARAAATLFENASNPGNPQVQAILRHLSSPKLSA
jgi:hypothetical protein